MKSEIEHTSTMLGSQNMKSSQRIVSVVEPYELPEGWKWISIGECCEKAFSGKSPKYSKEETPYKIIGQQANQRYGIDLKFVKFGTQEYAEAQADFYYLQYNDVILNTLGTGSIGRSGIYKYHEKILTDGHPFVFRTGTKYSPDLLFYYLRLNEQEIINTANGSTNQKFLSLKTFSKFPIPLPPTLAEQQRIVNRIESMFAKLDEAKEKAQNVVDGFETRKAAILHKAFTGELTAKWRKENGVSDDNWVEKRFDEVAEIKSNLVDVAEFQDFPHIAPDNIEKKTGVLLEYHTVAEDKVKSGKHRFYAGQILYSKIRPYLSKVVVVDFDGVCSADMYPIEAKGNTRFLWYQMLSNEFLDKASNSGSRSVLPKINQKELSVIPMQICSLPEQVEIVRILDIIIEKENKAKQAAEAVLEQIDLLKKSILARAFRGEL